MEITRREFARMAAFSIAAAALPVGLLVSDEAAAFAKIPASGVLAACLDASLDPATIKTFSNGRTIVSVDTTKSHMGPATAEYFSDGFKNMRWGPQCLRDTRARTLWPQRGSMALMIDYKGNWEFSGGFPPQQMLLPCATAVGIGLRSSAGQVVAFLAHGTIPGTGNGWSFSKKGHAQIVAALWKGAANGHDFHGSWSTEHIAPRNGNTRGIGGDWEVGGEVQTGIETALGAIHAILCS